MGPGGPRLVEVREGASLKDCPIDLMRRYRYGSAKKPYSYSNYFAREEAPEMGCAHSLNRSDAQFYRGADNRPYSPDSLNLVSRSVALFPISDRSLHLFSSVYIPVLSSSHFNTFRSTGSLS